MAKQLTTRFASKCFKCGKTIPVGEQAWWVRSKTIYHLACKPSFDPTVPEPVHMPPTSSSTTEIPYHYPSWSAFVDQAANGHSDMDIYSRHSHSGDRSFTLTESFDHAITLARNGWESELGRLSSFTSEILGELRPTLDTAFHSLYDVSGAEVDVARFISGDPENMIELVPVKVSRVGRVISININCSYSGGTDTAAVIERGAAVVALIDILSQLQHSTEVTLSFPTYSYFRPVRHSNYTVLIKSASQTLDLANLVFGIAHPSTLRRLVFSLKEQQPYKYRMDFRVGSGYGMPESIDPNSADVVIDKLDHCQDAKSWIIEHLTRFGLIGE